MHIYAQKRVMYTSDRKSAINVVISDPYVKVMKIEQRNNGYPTAHALNKLFSA